MKRIVVLIVLALASTVYAILGVRRLRRQNGKLRYWLIRLLAHGDQVVLNAHWDKYSRLTWPIRGLISGCEFTGCWFMPDREPTVEDLVVAFPAALLSKP